MSDLVGILENKTGTTEGVLRPVAKELGPSGNRGIDGMSWVQGTKKRGKYVSTWRFPQANDKPTEIIKVILELLERS